MNGMETERKMTVNQKELETYLKVLYHKIFVKNLKVHVHVHVQITDDN